MERSPTTSTPTAASTRPQGERPIAHQASPRPTTTAADSLVRATVPVVFVSNAGVELTQNVPIEFRSTHPVNVGSVALVALILLLLGILLPLIGLWILNWWTTRLDIDNSIQRATFPVRITPGSRRVPRRPGIRYRTVGALPLSRRDAQRARALGPRSRTHPRAAAVVPAQRPRVRDHAGAGHRHRGCPHECSRGVGGRPLAGRRAAVSQLPFDAFWAITVPDAELARTAKGDPVNGTAVVYHRFDAREPTQYRDRIADISATRRPPIAVDRLRAARLAEAARDSRRAFGRPRSPSTATVPGPIGRIPPASDGTSPDGTASDPGQPPARTGPPPRPSADRRCHRRRDRARAPGHPAAASRLHHSAPTRPPPPRG